jgi:hypothetical protein
MSTVYHKWTATELQYITDNSGTLSDEQLAEGLSRITGNSFTTAMIRRQRRKLTLKKSRGRKRKNKDSGLDLSSPVAE